MFLELQVEARRLARKMQKDGIVACSLWRVRRTGYTTLAESVWKGKARGQAFVLMGLSRGTSPA